MSDQARPKLIPTQWLVLERVVVGDDNATIAAELGLAPKTVRNYLTRLARELPRDPAVSRRATLSAWYTHVGRVQHEEGRWDGRGNIGDQHVTARPCR
jgi:hypothetical protein